MKYKSNKKDVEKALHKGTKNGLIKVGLFLQGAASLLSPVDTGRLRASITYVVEDVIGDVKRDKNGVKHPDDKPNGTVKRNTLHFGSNVDYAPFQEKQNPFLEPAIKKAKRKIEDIINSSIEKELK